jgi:hypothetical protein
MRTSVLALAVGAGLAVATPVFAASLNLMSDGLGTRGFSSPPQVVHGIGHPGMIFLPAQERYDIRLLALKTKMQRLAVQDGGQLSLKHQASLQRELDGVNRSFGLKSVHE